MNCFICNARLDSTRIMMHHFRLIHDMSENDQYVCTFNGDCNQSFSHLRSLSRHFKAHMETQNETDSDDSYIGDRSSDNSVLFDTLSDSSNPSTAHHSSEFVHVIGSPAHSNSEPENLSQLISPNFSIERKGLEFSLKLLSNDNFTRKDVFQIQKNIMLDIVNPIVNSVKLYTTENLSETFDDFDERLLQISLIERISNPFELCESESKLFKWLRSNDYVCDFNEFIINKEIGEKYSRGEIHYEEVEITGVLLPLSFQFRKVFEKNDMLNKTLKYMECIKKQSHSNCHFMHGSLWHQKSRAYHEAGEIVLPYFLYIDDSEVNNPLGPHADPITFIYYSFPVIQNSEIILGSLLKGKDYKEYGNQQCLQALVNQIRCLEDDGLLIMTTEGQKHVYFILGIILGDNLGINTILDFTTSFNHTYFCRPKISTHTMCIDNPNSYRNLENYSEDVDADDIDSTGIKKASIFNEINSFHATTNFSVDIMHDMFEGACHYDLCHIIRHMINSKYFSLKTLNLRKQMFNYGEIEIDHFSPEITQAHLNRSQLKMTAREMMTFIHLFPLMVGDLVPEDDHVWLFFLNFLDIIDILMLFEITQESAEELKRRIEKHHRDYNRFFNDTLKPKHHFMLHYYRVILQSGPPRHYWSFPFETKHRDFKTYARNITSRRNVCVSIAKKYQFKFANYLFEPDKPIYSVNSDHIIRSEHEQLITHFCDENQFDSNHFRCYSQCIYFSKIYKRGHLISQVLDECCENSIIYQIVEIISFRDCDSIHLICKRFKVERYYIHFASFTIDMSNESNQNEYNIIPIEMLCGPPINVHKTARGLNMIRPKQYC